MLVLKRRRGEGFVIRVAGVEIHVSFLEGNKDYARVGIEAPQEAKVYRDELVSRIDKERR